MFQVIGVPAVLKDLAAQAALLDRAGARRAFREGARIIGERARANAPRGQHSQQPGILKRSIVWFLGRKPGGRYRKIESVARANVRSGRSRAPHALLVETGRSAVTVRNATRLRMRIGRQTVFAKQVRAVPPNPYFARAVASTSSRAIGHILARLSQIVGSKE